MKVDKSDPVNKPWIGLTMRKGRKTRKITCVNQSAVYFVLLDSNGEIASTEWAPWRSQWAKWAANAEVVK